ncbi:hypothetical protein [Amycolatopsis samaneae]|uniref:Uncharacterized protein n=1 Tax=Amycolatopsis samaneae TaxID=664691 RepID=A0ABW5GWW6_9PSEU
MTHRQPVDPVARRHLWSHDEKSALVGAAREAPPRRIGCGWVVQVHDDVIDVFERPGVPVLGGDRAGRARLLGCGAVLANLEVTVRVLGWDPVVEVGGTCRTPDRIARITAHARTAPSRRERAEFRAVFGRPSVSEVDYRSLSGILMERLRPRVSGTGVRVRSLSEKGKRGWAGARYRPTSHSGLPGGCFAVTVDIETRPHLVRAGWVAQYLLLGAAELGAVGGLVTTPFAHLRARVALADDLLLPGLVELIVSVAVPGVPGLAAGGPACSAA